MGTPSRGPPAEPILTNNAIETLIFFSFFCYRCYTVWFLSNNQLFFIIIGPGGVAAAKPQGTAVAGPGGLAIARPVGTAISGVEVEGAVPIGGGHKKEKKPKQGIFLLSITLPSYKLLCFIFLLFTESEQGDSELHYVGGLTGPIGHPKPKEFPDTINYQKERETIGNYVPDTFGFRQRGQENNFQTKLGLYEGKYGFVPNFNQVQERADFFPTYQQVLGVNNFPFQQL